MVNANTERPAILIIDDEEQIRDLLSNLLSPTHDCTTVGSAEDALAILNSVKFNLVISDINMGGISGLDLVPLVFRTTPDTVVVMISGQQTIDSAIEAMRAGAFDYMTKPLDLRHVHTAVKRALAHHQLLTQKRLYENHLEELIKERTTEIEHLAYHDGLTDLPNRVLFEDRCTQAIAIAQRNNNLVAVMLVSLDRLKKVTESLGHAAGDVVLTEAAARLQQCVSHGDTVARFEGDEFALLLTNVTHTADLTEGARAIREIFNAPFRLGDQQVYVSTSIGISLFPPNGEDSGTILRNSEAALYRAKKHGGNNCQFYAADMNAMAVKRLELETSMRRAIENKEFITHYQPVVNLASGAVVGSEALVRWQHPDLGLLPPGRFIGLAEDTGLILDIGDFVLRDLARHPRLAGPRVWRAAHCSEYFCQTFSRGGFLRAAGGDSQRNPTGSNQS